MSITVPTADERTAAPPPPDPPRGGGVSWVGLVVILVLGVALWGSEERSTAPTGEVVDPLVAEADRVGPSDSGASAIVPSDWSQTFFPGEGTFTGYASALQGEVAVGQRRLPGGDAFVWARAHPRPTWTMREIERASQAVVRDVIPYQGGFVIAGAVVEPGSGSSTPTLWFGTATSGYSIGDQPFVGPGRVDRVTEVDGELILVGQRSGPFADNLAPGAARFGRVFAGSPGDWRDITPPGLSIVVTKVIKFDDGLLGVGADLDGAAIWWLAQNEAEWERVLQGEDDRGVVVDVVRHGDGGLVALLRTWDDRHNPRSALLRASVPSRWFPASPLLRRDVGWIAPTAGGVYGGVFDSLRHTGSSPLLWTLPFGGDWEFVEVAEEWADFGPTELRGGEVDSVGTIYGSAAGQPVLWHPESDFTPPQPEWEVTAQQWSAIGQLPEPEMTVVDTGRYLVGFPPSTEGAEIWFATDGADWRRVPVDPSFRLRGVGESADGLLVWGDTVISGVVLEAFDDGARWSVTPVGGRSVRHVITDGDRRSILAVGGDGSVRIDVLADGRAFASPVPDLPERIVAHDDVLVGFDHARPVDALQVSVDGGASWTTVRAPVFTVGASGETVLVVTAETPNRILAVDPATGDLVEAGVSPVRFDSDSALGTHLSVWAGGIFAPGPSLVSVTPDLAAIRISVPLDPDTGLAGVFRSPVPGPRGYAIVSEAGTPTLYRWQPQVGAP